MPLAKQKPRQSRKQRRKSNRKTLGNGKSEVGSGKWEEGSGLVLMPRLGKKWEVRKTGVLRPFLALSDFPLQIQERPKSKTLGNQQKSHIANQPFSHSQKAYPMFFRIFSIKTWGAPGMALHRYLSLSSFSILGKQL